VCLVNCCVCSNASDIVVYIHIFYILHDVMQLDTEGLGRLVATCSAGGRYKSERESTTPHGVAMHRRSNTLKSLID
jgi:hypothetical protein